MTEPIIVCGTSRLLLRHFTMQDLNFLVTLHSDLEVCRFIGGVRSVEQNRQNLEKWIAEYQRYGFSKWAVVLRSSGELVGRCGLANEQINGESEWELGWTFARGHWGKGYATEAAMAAMEHSFRVLGHRRLISLIHPEDSASMRVAVRIGMSYQLTVQWHEAATDLYAAANSLNA